MLGNSALKLVVGVAIGGFVYYTIKKNTIKQTTLERSSPKQTFTPKTPLQTPVKKPPYKPGKMLPPTAFIKGDIKRQLKHHIRHHHF